MIYYDYHSKRDYHIRYHILFRGCCLLEQIIAQFEWKYAEGLHALLDKVCGNLNNSYKNVRNILGQ